MTSTQGEHAQTAAQVQRYKIGYPTDSWGERSSTPSGIPDHAGAWVRYEDHAAQVAALTAAPTQPAAPQGVAEVNWWEADGDKYDASISPMQPAQGVAYADAHGAIMGAAYDFRDAHISGSPNQKRSAHAALESAVTHALRAPHGQAPATQQAGEVALDAAMRAIQQAIGLIGEPDSDRLRALRRVLRGAVIVVEDNAPQPAPTAQAAPAAGAVAGPSLQEIQWRNIRKVVDALADFCFGSQDDPRWGVAHVAIRTSLTAKDGLDVQALKLEPLAAPTPATQADSVLEDAADPLQGAADWLAEAHGQFSPVVLSGCLMIGYNRAKRLHDAALAARKQGGA